MMWRQEKGEKWDDVKGPLAKKRQKELVTSGKADGVIAFVDGEPVGWCSFGKRLDYPKLDRAPSLKCDDAEKVWSVPCFFIKSGFRGQGVATALLAHAIRSMKKKKANIIEGYPVKPSKTYKNAIPAAFAWTGTQPLFLKAGFEIVGNRDGGKQRVRLEI